MSRSQTQVNIRVWNGTVLELRQIATLMGVSPMRRLIDGLKNGFALLTDEQRAEAISQSQHEAEDATALSVWPQTKEELDQLGRETGMSGVKLMAAMAYGFMLLTKEQRWTAVEASADREREINNAATPGTPGTPGIEEQQLTT